MPTDRQSYLHAKSAHSLSLKRVFLTVKHYELNVFAQFLMNTKSIEMTLTIRGKRVRKKYHLKPNRKSRNKLC